MGTERGPGGAARPVRVSRTAPGLVHGNTLRLPRGSVLIVTDVRPGDPDELEHVFELSADDGSYRRSLGTKDSVVDEQGFASLRFDEVRTRRTYTLRARTEGRPEEIVFEKVPFEDLTRSTDALKPEQISPFGALRPKKGAGPSGG